MKSFCSRVLAASTAIVVLAATPARTPITVSITDGPPDAWIVLMSLGASGHDRVTDFKPGLCLSVPHGDPSLVCAGAPAKATQCRRITGVDPEALTFRLTAGRTVRGRCLLGRSPLPSATVRILPVIESRRGIPLPLRRERLALVTLVPTDERGEFLIENLEPGIYAFEIEARGGRVYEQERVQIPAPRKNDPMTPLRLADFRFEPGLSLVVQVTGPDGMPVSNASVGVLQRTVDALRPVMIDLPADRHGIATFDGLVPALPIDVTCLAKGFARSTQPYAQPPAIVRCSLERLSTLHGTVENDRHEPVENAVVSLRGDTGKHAKSDAKGRYSIADLRPGQYQLLATAPGYALGSASATTEEAEVETIQLKPGKKTTGTVTDAETGQPVSNAVIAIVSPPADWTSSTDASGRFELTVEENVTLDVRAPGYASERSLVNPAEPMLIQLRRPGALEVSAYDDDTDAECVACTIVASGPEGNLSAITDQTGVALFENLSPGEYQVTRERMRATSSYVTVSGGGTAQLATVRSREKTRLDLGTRGLPLRVSLMPVPEMDWQLRAVGASRVATVRREAAGTFAFRRRAGDPYSLMLVQGDRGVRIGTVAADLADPEVIVRLDQTRVTATFVRHGRAVVGAQVQLVSPDGTVWAWSRTDPGGHFTASYVRNGNYALLIDGLRTPGPVTVTGEPVIDLGALELP